MDDVVTLLVVDFELVALVWMFSLLDLALVIDEVAERLQVCFEGGVWWKTGVESAEHVEMVVPIRTL